jgi:hypothetical protein
VAATAVLEAVREKAAFEVATARDGAAASLAAAGAAAETAAVDAAAVAVAAAAAADSALTAAQVRTLTQNLSPKPYPKI